ncbi:MAG: recombinase family protein [Pseudomonadota bacterium]
MRGFCADEDKKSNCSKPDERFIIIFDDLKRASCDARAFLDLRDAFRDRRAQVECLNFKLDDSPEGEFLEKLFAAQGQLERKRNGRQVAQKMRAWMENGLWIHNPPVAYRYEKQPGRRRVLWSCGFIQVEDDKNSTSVNR